MSEVSWVFWDEGVTSLRLTPRQREFLNRICDHFLKNKEPVHYTTVAKWMGVSKWTAYDMLKRLERNGYLSSCYSVNEKGLPGRSLLLFEPGAGLKKLLEQEDASLRREWQAWKGMLFQRFERLRSGSNGGEYGSLIEELLAMLPEAKGPMASCACLIALFVAYLKTFNEQRMKMVRQMVAMISGPEQRLSLFSGTVAGIFSREMPGSGDGDAIATKEGFLAGMIDKFHQYLAGIDLKQHRLLAGFLDDLLQAVSC